MQRLRSSSRSWPPKSRPVRPRKGADPTSLRRGAKGRTLDRPAPIFDIVNMAPARVVLLAGHWDEVQQQQEFLLLSLHAAASRFISCTVRIGLAGVLVSISYGAGSRDGTNKSIFATTTSRLKNTGNTNKAQFPPI
jgi:hypothetical protein